MTNHLLAAKSAMDACSVVPLTNAESEVQALLLEAAAHAMIAIAERLEKIVDRLELVRDDVAVLR